MASRSAKKSLKEPKGNLYNAKGAPEAAEAEDEKDGMKKGGRAKHKAGGKVEGEGEKARADKKSRHKRAAGGRTPFTSGHNTSEPKESGKTNSGHEGERPSQG